MIVQKLRIAKFTAQLERYRTLRRLGVCTRAMAQATAAPAMLYGVDVQGVSDSTLLEVRRAAALAAAPEAGGKNTDLVLYAVDGGDGTLDPAFTAHGVPLKAWATA